MIKSIAAIGLGAFGGALIRWGLGLMLNSVFPAIPLGTLVANLAGGYLVGFFISLFGAMPQLAPEWRLLVITGFLGALTTFSTFSAEVSALLQTQRLFMAMGAIALHVVGSLIMTFLGMGTFSLLRALHN